MKLTRLLITGPQIIDLIHTLQADLEPPYAYANDPVVVLIDEKYYFRNDSTLQTTLVFALIDDAQCALEIISGGGSTDLIFERDRGAEQSRNLQLVRSIEKMCNEHGWTIAKEEWF